MTVLFKSGGGGLRMGRTAGDFFLIPLTRQHCFSPPSPPPPPPPHTPPPPR